MEQIGDATGLVTDRVEGDLKRFKDYIETRALKPVPGEAR
jgi:hypothetical protein